MSDSDRPEMSLKIKRCGVKSACLFALLTFIFFTTNFPAHAQNSKYTTTYTSTTCSGVLIPGSSIVPCPSTGMTSNAPYNSVKSDPGTTIGPIDPFPPPAAGLCRYVQNLATSSASIFVPFNSLSEWSDFLLNAPTNYTAKTTTLNLIACARPVNSAAIATVQSSNPGLASTMTNLVTFTPCTSLSNLPGCSTSADLCTSPSPASRLASLPYDQIGTVVPVSENFTCTTSGGTVWTQTVQITYTAGNSDPVSAGGMGSPGWIRGTASYIGSAPAAATCGPASGVGATTVPTTNLCPSGETASAILGTGPWDWNCVNNTNATDTIACSAPINGSCGTAGGAQTPTAPTTNLCATGTASAVSGNGPWNWTCAGIGAGATNASCSDVNVVNGTCAAATGTCTTGTLQPGSQLDNGTTTTWICDGSGGGTSTNPPCSTLDTPATCGPANGVGLLTGPPVANLCSSTETASGMSGTGPWNWTCTDNTSIASISCSAGLNGQCGLGTGSSGSASAPPSNLCAQGTASVPGLATSNPGYESWSWTCGGSGPGASTASCVGQPFANLPPINAVCTSTPGVCSTGTYQVGSQNDNGTNTTWICDGSNGGSNASCSMIDTVLTASCGPTSPGTVFLGNPSGGINGTGSIEEYSNSGNHIGTYFTSPVVKTCTPPPPTCTRNCSAHCTYSGGPQLGMAADRFVIDSLGNIWALGNNIQGNNNSIYEYSCQGILLNTFPLSIGTNPGQFDLGSSSNATTTEMKIDANDNIYIVDYDPTNYRMRIYKFSNNMTYLGQIIDPNESHIIYSSQGYPQYSNAILTDYAFDPNGNIFISDPVQALAPQPSGIVGLTIYEVDANSNLMNFFGPADGTGPGQFLVNTFPNGPNLGDYISAPYLAVDLNGNIYATDTMNARIQKFNNSGAFTLQFGTPGTGPGTFAGQLWIAVDPSGNLWALGGVANDGFTPTLQKFSPNGQYLGGSNLTGSLFNSANTYSIFIRPSFKKRRFCV